MSKPLSKKQQAAATESANRASIKRWMRAHIAEHTDRLTGEIDCTGLVEEWDRACADGGVTRDSDHPAWEIAVDVAERAGR